MTMNQNFNFALIIEGNMHGENTTNALSLQRHHLRLNAVCLGLFLPEQRWQFAFYRRHIDRGRVCKYFMRQNLQESIIEMNIQDNYVLQQDNDPKHTCKVATRYFTENNIQLLFRFKPNRAIVRSLRQKC